MQLAVSAWKQFFFIDCLGHENNADADTEVSLDAVVGPQSQNHHSKALNEFDSLTEVSVDSNSLSISGPFRYSHNTRTKSLSMRSRYRRGWVGLNKDRPTITTTSFCLGDSRELDDRKSSKFSRAGTTSSGNGVGERRVRGQSRLRSKLSGATLPATKSVRSPSNKALLQTDPLFHLYLICVGLITLSILAIKCLIPGMPIYPHTVIGFAFLLVVIVVSSIYTQVNSRKVGIQFRILLWLIISGSLTMLQLVDLIVPEGYDKLNEDSVSGVSHADSGGCALAWYYTFTIIVAMTATSIFIRINVWLKFLIHSSTIVFYIMINNPPATMLDTLKEFLETQSNNWSLLDHKQKLSHLFYITMIAVILHLIDRQVEYILSLNIKWNEQLESDRIESQSVGEVNRLLLENILPPHVLKRYLYNTTVSYDQLYHESHPSCAVMFASIPNYESFYTETKLNEQGLKCLQLLNEIICDFDQLLSHPDFRKIEKIKTIGSTYMAACFDVAGRSSDCSIDKQEVSNGVTMVYFATALMENLARINQDAFQEFELRIGIAIGPVIAGVVGASKPTYDIWGDTVNVASRLESNGVPDRIQVSEQVAKVVGGHFEVECRGPIFVKGKGQLTTYLVVTPKPVRPDKLDGS